MHTFDMVVVGSGGGCDETNLSSYLIKPATAAWTDGIISLEGGSGQGALQQILQRNPKLLDCRKRYTASEIYSHVQCFLITHGHLDHVSSLVLSAGSLKGPRKRLYAAKDTLGDMETIFSDRIWPNLASWKESDDAYKYLYTPCVATPCSTASLLTLLQSGPSPKHKRVHTDVSVRSFRLNHGSNDSGAYESSAFSIRHDPTGREFLFFGDVEPDSLARHPRTLDVWRYAASKIPTTLSTIFIECSWPPAVPTSSCLATSAPSTWSTSSSRSPPKSSKLGERRVAPRTGASASQEEEEEPIEREDRAGALKGLRVYITHCKADFDAAHDRPIHEVIAGQVRQLVKDEGLGVEIIAAEQGMRIEI
ncbi:cAMP phosphodiesterases class-II-domain-containing protein [Schizophyllum amplum]|uniref:cAMP phosphodiesterases class-II-domain-containing protein n=1 Tax=Schizophyllum amplum TaxID=97359 RepID=A0A550C3N9_9AGAR|nr:cAMP phosphodiesterases class-II-domain-containing protein [Auriculariopsis ampla]